MKNLNFFLQALRMFLIEGFLFLIIFFLGLLTLKKNYFQDNVQFYFRAPAISFLKFIFYFFCVTLFLFLIIYFLKSKRKKRIILKIIFLFPAFFGSFSLLLFWFQPLLVLLLILIIIFWWAKRPKVINHDILIILGTSGVSTVLGQSFSPEILVYLLIFFSIYDIVAVYKTKHMVKMAKEMMEHQAILALVVPKKLEGFNENIEKVVPGENFLILGGGDLAFPAIFSLSLYQRGIWASIIVAAFSLVGFFANNLILFSQKERKAIPALPLIALFSIIGYLIAIKMR